MYEYKLVVVRGDITEHDGEKRSKIPSDRAVEHINELGLEGWVVRSHQFDRSDLPIVITYLLGRKLDVSND